MKVVVANIYYLINILEIDFLLIIFHVVFSNWFGSHTGGRTFKLETHQEILVNS